MPDDPATTSAATSDASDESGLSTTAPRPLNYETPPPPGYRYFWALHCARSGACVGLIVTLPVMAVAYALLSTNYLAISGGLFPLAACAVRWVQLRGDSLTLLCTICAIIQFPLYGVVAGVCAVWGRHAVVLLIATLAMFHWVVFLACR